MRRRQFIVAAIGSTLLSSRISGIHASPASTTGPWSRAASVPIQTQEIYPCVHKGRLYVAGGISPRLGVPAFTGRCFSFSPSENRWQEEASLPESLHHAALVSDGERLFCVGGFHGGLGGIWQMRDSVYELTKDRWRLAGQLPAPQAEGVLSKAPTGRIHLVTGQSPIGKKNRARSEHQEINRHLSWHPSEDKWREETPIPTPRNSATGGWLEDELVIAGGRTAQGNLATTEIYSLRTQTWRTAKSMPTPQAGSASVTYNGQLIVFGGEIFVPTPGVFGDVWRYELSSDRWQPLADMPTPRHGIGAVRFDTRAFVIAGATEVGGRGTSNLNEVLDLTRD